MNQTLLSGALDYMMNEQINESKGICKIEREVEVGKKEKKPSRTKIKQKEPHVPLNCKWLYFCEI